MRPKQPPLHPALIALASSLPILVAIAVASARPQPAANTPAAQAERAAATVSEQPSASPSPVVASPASPSSPVPAASHTAPTVAAKPTPKYTMPYAAAGMVVSIDPATGRIGPHAAPVARDAADPALSRSMEGLVVEHRPDGSKMIDLRGRFHEYMVVHLTPDGQKVERCVPENGVGAALAPPQDAARATPASPETEDTTR